MKKITLLMVALLLSVMGVNATPTTTTLDVTGGWSYSRSGEATVAFSGWGHFNIANVGDIDVANYKSITMNYSNLSGRFQIATIGTVGEDTNHSMETSEEINSNTKTSGSVTITFDANNYGSNTYKETRTIISSVDLIDCSDDNASIKIESVILTDKSDNTYVMGYGERWGSTPTYSENKYTFQSWGQAGHGAWKTDYVANTIQRFTIEFGESIPAGFKFRIYTPDGDDEGTDEDESYQDIAEGSTSATIDIDYTYNNIDLVNTSGNYATVDIASVTRTVITITTTTLYSGAAVSMGGWKNFESLRTDNKGGLANIKIGDVIRLTCTNATDGNEVNICNGFTYGTFANCSKSLTVQAAEQTIEFEISDAETIERIIEGGIVISGKLFTLTKVELITNDTHEALTYSPITITSAGAATYNSSHALDFTNSNIKAYIATAVSVENNTVTMTRIYKVPAQTGLYLVADEGNYTVPYYNGETDDTSTNLLKRTDLWKTNVAASTTGAFHYIFAKKKTGDANIGFYKLTSAHTLDAHKAYLETTDDITPTNNAPLMLDYGDGTTAIMDVFQDEMKQQQAQEDNVYYTLQGTRVQNPTKDLYILNGKKIIVK